MNSFDAHIHLYLMIVIALINPTLCLILVWFWYIGFVQFLDQKVESMTHRQMICLSIGFLLGLVALNHYSIDNFEVVMMQLIRILIIVALAVMLACIIDIFFLCVFILLYWSADGIDWLVKRCQLMKDEKARNIHETACRAIAAASQFLKARSIICLTIE